MKPGEAFEIRCYEYLTKKYGHKFCHKGGMNSTKSDIAVIKNKHIDYFIEAKDSAAQSGQFVLLPDEKRKIFVFSPKNRTFPNEMTKIIIEYMNQDFDRFNNAGTTGESLNIDSSVFFDWIIEYYQSKNVKYVISYGTNFVIFPIRKFASYFDVVAKYRIKKSGSSEPSKKDIPLVRESIKSVYPSINFWTDGKKLYSKTYDDITQSRFILENHSYYLAERETNTYEVRKLSNTNNMNVIFSINLKSPQNINDLKEFESDL